MASLSLKWPVCILAGCASLMLGCGSNSGAANPGSGGNAGSSNGGGASGCVDIDVGLTLPIDRGDRFVLEFGDTVFEVDPAWRGQPRFVAPARSRWHGYICDLSARPYMIIYRVVDGGAAIEVPVIQIVVF